MTDPVEFSLYSRSANNMVLGRKADKSKNQYPIYGLIQFSEQVNSIWSDARKNNPYALWYLMKLDARFSKSRAVLDKHKQWLDGAADDGTGIVYNPVLNVPKSNTVHLTTPYAWEGLRQIKLFDDIFLLGKKLNSVGLVSMQEFSSAHRESNRLISGAFNEAFAYRSFDLLTNDPSKEKALLKLAYDAMGVVPPKVIRGDIGPLFNPNFEAKH